MKRSNMNQSGFRPRLRIGGVPLHTRIVPFPLVCFTGALLTDIAYLNSEGQVQWANFSQWLLAFGELTGVVAGLLGVIDLLANRRESRPAATWVHMLGSMTALTLGLFNNLVHARDGWTGVVPTGIILSALTVAVLMLTGFLGRRLVHVHQARAYGSADPA